MWFHNTATPYWMPSPQLLDGMLSENGGTHCKCYENKEASHDPT